MQVFWIYLRSNSMNNASNAFLALQWPYKKKQSEFDQWVFLQHFSFKPFNSYLWFLLSFFNHWHESYEIHITLSEFNHRPHIFSWENMANRIWLNAVAPFEVRIILWFVNPVEQAKLTRVETPSTQASRSIEQWRGQCFGRDSCPLQLIVTAVIYFAVFQTDTASFVSSGFRVSERLWSRLKEIHVDCC